LAPLPLALQLRQNARPYGYPGVVVLRSTLVTLPVLLQCEHSHLIPQLRAKDADWRTTELCRHETLNVLATYQRREVLSLEQCRELLNHADQFIAQAQCEVNFAESLDIAALYVISGYDAQYVALAASLSVPLISEDRKLRQAAPEMVMSMQQFIALEP
jgi:predicted nucleic acid-binding protein